MKVQGWAAAGGLRAAAPAWWLGQLAIGPPNMGNLSSFDKGLGGEDVGDQNGDQAASERRRQRLDLARAAGRDEAHRDSPEFLQAQAGDTAVHVVLDLDAVRVEEPAADVADHALGQQAFPLVWP